MLKNLKTPVKSIGVLYLVLLATPFVKPDAALAGHFARTCTNTYISIQGNRTVDLNSTCKNNIGQFVLSRLTISNYIANYGGNLSWALGGGGFQASCTNIHKSPNSQGYLEATCGNGRGGWVNTSINLNEKISNQNGVLAIDR